MHTPPLRPLIGITNDDSLYAKGLQVLIEEMKPLGDVVVVASQYPMSGKGHSITSEMPLRLEEQHREEGLTIYRSNGTPVDCFKLLQDVVLAKKPLDLLVSGINHGCNASINALYSGTMGAAIEACMCQIPSIGFSLDDFGADASFEHTRRYVREIATEVLNNGLPAQTCLNVNFPAQLCGIKGLKVCEQASARWQESFDTRIDPQGKTYYWLQGNFLFDRSIDNDYTLLKDGYATIVPTQYNLTNYHSISSLKTRFEHE